MRSERGGFPKGSRPHQRVHHSKKKCSFIFVISFPATEPQLRIVRSCTHEAARCRSSLHQPCQRRRFWHDIHSLRLARFVWPRRLPRSSVDSKVLPVQLRVPTSIVCLSLCQYHSRLRLSQGCMTMWPLRSVAFERVWPRDLTETVSLAMIWMDAKQPLPLSRLGHTTVSTIFSLSLEESQGPRHTFLEFAACCIVLMELTLVSDFQSFLSELV